MKFLEVLNRIRVGKSTDPRDKVYAALSLAEDVSPEELVPEYAKPVEEAYQDGAKVSLIRSSLEFLGYVFHRYSSEPPISWEPTVTWLPDWRHRGRPAVLQKSVSP